MQPDLLNTNHIFTLKMAQTPRNLSTNTSKLKGNDFQLRIHDKIYTYAFLAYVKPYFGQVKIYVGQI